MSISEPIKRSKSWWRSWHFLGLEGESLRSWEGLNFNSTPWLNKDFKGHWARKRPGLRGRSSLEGVCAVLKGVWETLDEVFWTSSINKHYLRLSIKTDDHSLSLINTSADLSLLLCCFGFVSDSDSLCLSVCQWWSPLLLLIPPLMLLLTLPPPLLPPPHLGSTYLLAWNIWVRTRRLLGCGNSKYRSGSIRSMSHSV